MNEKSPHRHSEIKLRADCQNCYGLCCVALPFSASADFAISKAAGDPCRNLLADFQCRIHDDLRPSGFAGCTVFDCFGAGQQVSQVIYRGRDWRGDATTATEMFTVFPIVRQLHELLFYLEEALTLTPARALHSQLRTALDSTSVLVSGSPTELLHIDVAARRASIGALLVQASSLARATAAGNRQHRRRAEHARADLMGARLAQSDQRGADFRGAYLIGADLRGADLRLADLLGADLRAADLSGADLSTALFVTQFQLNAARGDTSTMFPAPLTRPGHWTG